MGYRLLYMRPSDDLIPDATVTVQRGTAAAAYPVANLKDRATFAVAKLNEVTGAWMADLGSAKEVGLCGIHHTNLDAGLQVRLRGNSVAADWGAAPFDQAIAIPGRGLDGFSIDPFLDLTVSTPLAAGRTYRYWLLDVVGNNSAAPAIGEWTLGARRELERNISWGYKTPDARPVVDHQTDAGAGFRYPRGTRDVRLSGRVDGTTAAGAASLKAWWQDAGGRARASFVAPDPAVNECFLMLWENQPQSPEFEFKNVVNFDVAWQELGRGLPL